MTETKNGADDLRNISEIQKSESSHLFESVYSTTAVARDQRRYSQQVELGAILPSLVLHDSNAQTYNLNTAKVDELPTSVKTLFGKVVEVDYPNGTNRRFVRDIWQNVIAIQDTDESFWRKNEGDNQWSRFVNGKKTNEIMDGKPNVNAKGDYSLTSGDGKSVETYYADGSSKTLRDDGSSSLTNVYGQLAEVRSADGFSRKFLRDSAGDLISVENPDKSTWSKQTDQWILTDREGNDVKYTHWSPKINADGSFSFSADDGSTTFYHQNGTSDCKQADGSNLKVDQKGDVVEINYLHGSKRTFQFDSEHKLIGFTDVDGSYRQAENSAKVNADGTLQFFNDHGDIINKYPGNGAAITLDSDGHVTCVGYAAGMDRQFRYDEHGNLVNVIETNGYTWNKTSDGTWREYSNDGQSTGVTDVAQRSVDQEGNYLISNSDNSSTLQKSDGAAVKFDKSHHATEVEYADGQARHFRYDDKGNLTRMVDSKGTIYDLEDGEWKKYLYFGTDPDPDGNGRPSVTDDGTVKISQSDQTIISTSNIQLSADNGYDLYGNKANPLLSITPNAVHQGGLGDCYFLAAVAALAQQHPEAIRDMIHDNENGTFTITFPADVEHPVLIDAPNDHEIKSYAGADVNGMWVNVLEKAHRKYTDRWDHDSGGYSNTGLSLLTGKQTQTDGFAGWFGTVSEEDAGRHLEAAMKEHRAVTAAVGDNDWFNRLGTTNDPGSLVHDHVYGVIAYDPATKMVTLRNPWGDGNGNDNDRNGTFQISLHDLRQHMTNISYVV